MSTIIQLKTYLDTIVGVGTLKMGNMPETPDDIGTLYQYPGPPPIRRFGISGIGYEHSAFQLVFRGTPLDFVGPMTKARLAVQALTEVQATTLSGTEYLQIDPQQDPGQIRPVDENKRHYIGFNFYVMKVPS